MSPWDTVSPGFVSAVMADFYNGLITWREAHEKLRAAFAQTRPPAD